MKKEYVYSADEAGEELVLVADYRGNSVEIEAINRDEENNYYFWCVGLWCEKEVIEDREKFLEFILDNSDEGFGCGSFLTLADLFNDETCDTSPELRHLAVKNFDDGSTETINVKPIHSRINGNGNAYRMYNDCGDIIIESVRTNKKYILTELHEMKGVSRGRSYDIVSIFCWEYQPWIESMWFGEHVDFFAGANCYDESELLREASNYIDHFEAVRYFKA